MSNKTVNLAYPTSADETSVPSAPVGVYAKTVKGGLWHLINAGGQKVFQIVVFFILARLLVPADYGVFAAIMIVIGFFNQLTDVPFGTALIQRRGDVEKYLDAYWTFDMLRSLFNAGLIALCGGWIAARFNMQAHETLIRLCGILLVIPTFSNIRTIFLFREMDFRTLTIRDLSTQCVYAIVAISYACWVERSAAALIVGFIAMYSFGVFLSYVLIPGKPRFSFAFGRLRDLVGYSKWVYGQDLVDYAAQYADKILLGVTLAPEQLGLYSKAKDLSTSPSVFIASIARKVGLSAFALIQDSRVKIREGILRSFDVLFLTAVPAALLFLLEGGTIIQILLGTRWLSIVIPFKIMAFGGIFLAVNNIINTTVMGIGKPDASFKANVMQTLISLPFSWVGIHFGGIVGLAYATLVVWMILTTYLYVKVRHEIQVSRFDAFRLLGVGFITTLVLSVLDKLISPFVHAYSNLWLDAGWIGVLGLVYFAMIYVFGAVWKIGPWITGRIIVNHLAPRRSH